MLNVMENKKIEHPYNTNTHSIIKTGTVGDGSCFFHSIMTALSATYRSSDIHVKKRYIKKFRKRISDTFDMNGWHTFPGMEMLVQNNIYKNMKHRFTTDLERSPLHTKMRCLCSFSRLDMDILPRAFDLLSIKYKEPLSENNYINDLYTYIVTYIEIFSGHRASEIHNKDKETLTKPYVQKRWDANIDNREEVLELFRESIKNILEVSEKEIFEEFKESVKNVSVWIENDILVKHVCDMIKINILIWNSREEKPYNLPIRRVKGRPYIILHYIPGLHFEGMGLYSHETRHIQRKFSELDKIVTYFG